MDFNKWLDTLIEEKGINKCQIFEIDKNGTLNLMTYGVVLEAIKRAPAHEKKSIKFMLAKIDIMNGDIKDYLQHLGKALAFEI